MSLVYGKLWHELASLLVTSCERETGVYQWSSSAASLCPGH